MGCGSGMPPGPGQLGGNGRVRGMGEGRGERMQGWVRGGEMRGKWKGWGRESLG